MKILIAHTGEENIFGVAITAGKTYPVFRDEEKDFVIITDANREMSFAKEINRNGLSYKDWFDLVE
ncbi:hypothetical protein [Bacillus sp. FJAT-22090]|uniref:hypothetical protein n=1 Tax=Bacillus sp. FJAT-22090 TaxID=1581038 RepID=UPI0011A69867|nr:hypothetical protein [Bacillus sp. FJAT-22090]